MVIDFITSGISEFVQDAYIWLLKKYLIMYFETKIWMLQTSVEVAKELVQAFSISDKINEALGYLDSQTIAIANKCKIPEFINMIVNAFLTRFVFKFMGN